MICIIICAFMFKRNLALLRFQRRLAWAPFTKAARAALKNNALVAVKTARELLHFPFFCSPKTHRKGVLIEQNSLLERASAHHRRHMNIITTHAPISERLIMTPVLFVTAIRTEMRRKPLNFWKLCSTSFCF